MLYYTDPLVAAYMAREFGVGFLNKEHVPVTHDCLILDIVSKHSDCYAISLDSYHIFKRQAKDLLQSPTRGEDHVIYIHPEHNAHMAEWHIIQREGKQFFWPEKE